MNKTFALQDIAEHIGATLEGDSNAVISSISSLVSAGNGQLTFVSDERYLEQLSSCQATAVIIKEQHKHASPVPVLVVADPYLAYAKAAQLLDNTPDSALYVAPSAVIDPSVNIADSAHVGANAVIEAGAVIGENVQIGPGCVIGKNAEIGQGTKLWANVTIYHNVLIGEDCLIHAGTVIGSDGFGYANDKGTWVKIPQVGRVVVGNKVEIGSATAIDRGAIEDTIIGDGVIIDNLCHIAHNVSIGDNVAMAATAAIAGSSKIGKNCTMAGRVGINGHTEVADNCHFTAYTMVTKTITKAGVYSGMPAEPAKTWRKNIVNIRHVGALKERLKKLEKINK